MNRKICLLLALWLLGPPVQAQTQTVRYIHTDALGSVVVITDENRQVVERREYEPYGAQLRPAVQDGPGYTGHVQDAVTGLVYMQQRYYDPKIGRFLSVDPVTANSGTGANFNRYWYAANNPYKYIDPDGRLIFLAPVVYKVVGGAVGGAAAEIGMQMLSKDKNFSNIDWSEDIDWSDVAVSAAGGAAFPGALGVANKARKAVPAAKSSVEAIKKLSKQARNTPGRAAKLSSREIKHVGSALERAGDVAEGAAAAGAGVLLKNLGQKAINDAQESPLPPPPPPPPRPRHDNPPMN